MIYKIRINLPSLHRKERALQLLGAGGANRLTKNVSLKNIKLLSLKRKKYQQAETFESNLDRIYYQKISPLKLHRTRVKGGNSQLNKIEPA